MSFAVPLMLWWGLLAIPVVALYVLKVRVRRVPVSTLMFWERVYDEKAPRSLWERLRHLSSLLMQLALLGLLVFAPADPVFDGEAQAARRVVLVIDNSASMKATDETPNRLEAAKRKAVDLLDGLRPRDEMAVLTAGVRPAVVVGMTGHVRTLRRAVEGIAATDGPTRVTETVELARRLLAGQENGQIVVLTDAAFPGAEAVATGAKTTWLPVGGPAANVGITRFQVRRSLLDPIGYEVLAEVTNRGDAAVETRLDLDLAGQPVDAVPLKLEPGQVWRQVFEKASAGGRELVVSLVRKERGEAGRSAKPQAAGDALAVDDVAVAILPERTPRPVVLVTAGNVFLESVFRASSLVELSVVKTLPQERPADALVVFHRDVPKILPDGPVLVIAPTGSTDAFDLAGRIENPVVAKQSADSPLLAHVKLADALLPEARKLVPKPVLKADVLAEAADGTPLLFSARRPNGKLLVLAVDLDKGDLPLRTAFPILLTNALAWYADGAGELREAVAAGSLVTVPIASGARYELRAPDGSIRPVAATGKTATVGPLDQVGLWRLVPEAMAKSAADSEPNAGAAWPAGTIEIACNLADPAESDISPTYRATDSDEPSAARWAGRPVWFYLLVGASLLIPAEWLLYQRRWIQ